MYLHPLHRERGYAPVTMADASALAGNAAPQEDDQPGNEEPQDTAPWEHLHWTHNKVGPTLSTEGKRVSVSLPLAEARWGVDGHSGLPLLAIAPAFQEAQVWLVLVNANSSERRHVNAKLAACGVVCHDIHEYFRIQGEPLAEGGTAAIYAVDLPSGEPSKVVAKIEKENVRSRSKSSAEGGHGIQYEAAMLAAVQGHPHVARLHGLFLDELRPRWILTLERYRTDLHSTVARMHFSEDQARHTMKGLFSALAYLHSLDIVHRDVKPENILFTSNWQPVLADFGLACHSWDESQMSRRCGSRGYIAPEVMAKGRICYTCKVDCFSSGAVLYFMLARRPPDAESSAKEIAQKARLGYACKHLLFKLLAETAQRRPTMEEVLAHRWITKTKESIQAASAGDPGHAIFSSQEAASSSVCKRANSGGHHLQETSSTRAQQHAHSTDIGTVDSEKSCFDRPTLQQQPAPDQASPQQSTGQRLPSSTENGDRSADRGTTRRTSFKYSIWGGFGRRAGKSSALGTPRSRHAARTRSATLIACSSKTWSSSIAASLFARLPFRRSNSKACHAWVSSGNAWGSIVTSEPHSSDSSNSSSGHAQDSSVRINAEDRDLGGGEEEGQEQSMKGKQADKRSRRHLDETVHPFSVGD